MGSDVANDGLQRGHTDDPHAVSGGGGLCADCQQSPGAHHQGRCRHPLGRQQALSPSVEARSAFRSLHPFRELRHGRIQNLPPFNDFLKCKESPMLRMRRAFVDELGVLHRKTLSKHSTLGTAKAEDKAHELWDARRQAMGKRQKQQAPAMPCFACAAAWGS